MKILFGDIAREYRSISGEINRSISDILSSGWLILGQELEKFEKSFAGYLGAKYCVGCASGTDAITLALRASGIRPGDEVITQANTCIPTVCGIANSFATPVFCDCEEDSLMIDADSLEFKITRKTKAFIPVNLYGASADYDKLLNISKKYSIPMIEDCAQSHGSEFNGKKTGTFGRMSCFSFYPSKNLGCYGDGGAVVTNSRHLCEKLLLLRNYGQKRRYYHQIPGFNSRLDEIQAGILNVKLRYLDLWNKRRREIAGMYNHAFEGSSDIIPLKFAENVSPVFHLYVARVKKRKKLQNEMIRKNIQTFIHYPVPCHLQKAYSYLGYKKGDFPVSEKAADEVLSFPIHPQLKNKEVEYVIDSVGGFYGK